MITIVTNMDQVLKASLKQLESLLDDDKITRQAALDAVALVSNRVQNDGKKTDGSEIQSFYSKGYASKRSKKGLQTNFVDLTFTGDMMDSFIPFQNEGDWVAGFNSEKQGQKAEWNEMRFGTIFELSQSELQIIEKGIIQRVGALIQ